MNPRKKSIKPLIPNPSARRRRRPRTPLDPDEEMLRYTRIFDITNVPLTSISPLPSFYEDPEPAQPSTSTSSSYSSGSYRNHDMPAAGPSSSKPIRETTTEEDAAAFCNVVNAIRLSKTESLKSTSVEKVKQRPVDDHKPQHVSVIKEGPKAVSTYKDQSNFRTLSTTRTSESPKSDNSNKSRRPNIPPRSPGVAKAYEELKESSKPRPFDPNPGNETPRANNGSRPSRPRSKAAAAADDYKEDVYSFEHMSSFQLPRSYYYGRKRQTNPKYFERTETYQLTKTFVRPPTPTVFQGLYDRFGPLQVNWVPQRYQVPVPDFIHFLSSVRPPPNTVEGSMLYMPTNPFNTHHSLCCCNRANGSRCRNYTKK